MHAIAIEKSGNAKLGAMSTTYASFHSCPTTCKFYQSKSCYGMHSFTGIIMRRFCSTPATPEKIAEEEAAAISRLTGKLPLRIHTAGDCSTKDAASLVSNACEGYTLKHGQTAYTYTHAWRGVPREAWGNVSVLASCETVKDTEEASKLGYATSIVLPDFDTTPKVIKCPKQLGTSESCAACGLCMNDEHLKKHALTIAFKAHGCTTRAKAMLKEVNE